MKHHYPWILFTLLGCVSGWGAEAGQKVSAPNLAAQTASLETDKPRIIDRWPDGRVWQRVTTRTLTNGQTVLHTNRWTDLASGMHYWDANHWKETRANIVITDEGAEAKEGPHKVRFAGNINTVSAIGITGPDGVTLRAQVVGLAYTDLSTGESVLLATVQNSIGELLPPNQVVYPDAFAGLRADLRYTYSKEGFEQDVILREGPPAPSTFGLGEESTVLEVWTEFDAPEPQRRAAPSNGLPDETLSFGRLHIARGVAFALDNPEPRRTGTPVGKTWLPVQGRQYLIESVPLRAVEKELKKLPLRAALPSAPAGNRPALRAAAPSAPKPRLAWLQRMEPRRAAAPASVRLALDDSVIKRAPGLVLDWIIYGGSTDNFTFQADTCYLISDGFSIMDKAVMEGGTVIKVGTTNPTTIQFFGELELRTDPYRPVIMTSQNDTSVGLDFTAPGSPAKYHGAIAAGQEYLSLSHLRISHAQYGLQTYGLTLSDAQFTHCDRAFYSHNYPIEVNNVLFHKVGRVFAGSGYTASAHHITVNECAQLSDDFEDPEYSQVAITNSLLVNVTNLGTVNLTTNFTVVTTTNPFQTVGAGAHYLADPSPYRDAGTTNIPATLTGRLKKTTTYPPIVLNAGGYTGISQTLSRTCTLDTNTPDLGYHYIPLDYAVTETILTNATFTVTAGTAVALFSATNAIVYGLGIGEGASLIAEGRAEAKVHFTHFATVQEMAGTAWNGPLDFFVFTLDGGSALRCRFTDFTTLARSANATNTGDAHYLLYSDGAGAGWQLTDAQLFGGQFMSGGVRLAVTNALFHRVYVNAEGYQDVTNRFDNCTFSGGRFNAYQLSTNHARMQDTLFVEAMISAELSSTHIGYVRSERLTPTNASDRVLASLSFETGPLGYFYIPSNGLVNAGSRNATNAGLYHFTMLTNNLKETNSMVDIGFHYAATDSNGLPFNFDADGVPDYWEDQNGNGLQESAEINWQDADTDYDGRNDGQEFWDGTQPLVASSVSQVRLGYWKFNTSSWLGEEGQQPVLATNVHVAASWSSNSVRINTNATARLAYRELEANAQANINCRNGTVRFWFQPGWSSTNLGAGLTNDIEVLSVGAYSGDASHGWWSVFINSNGTSLKLITQANSVGTTNVQAPIGWASNIWHQLVLTYTPTNSSLYIDGAAVVTNGTGILNYPNSAVRLSGGFSIGAGNAGTRQARGNFEELETFNYPLSGAQIASDYSTVLNDDSDGDGTTTGEDINPNSAFRRRLKITIDAPVNGSTLP